MAQILVADDDPDIREIVALILEVAGHEVSTVPDGAAALQAIRSGAYAVAVLDNTMPFLTGIEVLEACQDLDADRRPLFVMLSALSSRRDVRAGMSAGADAYLAKPFDSAQLVGCVSTLLQERLVAQERDATSR